MYPILLTQLASLFRIASTTCLGNLLDMLNRHGTANMSAVWKNPFFRGAIVAIEILMVVSQLHADCSGMVECFGRPV